MLATVFPTWSLTCLPAITMAFVSCLGRAGFAFDTSCFAWAILMRYLYVRDDICVYYVFRLELYSCWVPTPEVIVVSWFGRGFFAVRIQWLCWVMLMHSLQVCDDRHFCISFASRAIIVTHERV